MSGNIEAQKVQSAAAIKDVSAQIDQAQQRLNLAKKQVEQLRNEYPLSWLPYSYEIANRALNVSMAEYGLAVKELEPYEVSIDTRKRG